MKQILEDYIEYLKIPNWNKELKHLKHQTLHRWHKKEYSEIVNYDELKEFEIYTDQNGFHNYKTQFFFEKIEFDIYYKEITENSNLEVIKLLYKSYGGLLSNREKSIELDLIELGLQIDKNDTELLKEKLKNELSFLRYTIHEVPWIVIAFGSNSANVEDTRKLFKILDKTIELAEKANEKMDEELINDCIFYWTNWINFLETKNETNQDFKKYLNINKKSR